MFIQPERVTKITGYADITLQDINIAQSMLESVIGRMEARITDADDLEIMAKATAYQTVYIKSDPQNVFEQAAMRSITQDTAVNSYDTEKDSPFVAPLAQIAMRGLSWRRSRSVRMGRSFTHGRARRDWKRD